MSRLLVIFVLCFFALGAQAKSELKNIRWSKGKNHYRLVFDLSKKSNYNVFALSNPSRIVIDIDSATWKARVKPRSVGNHTFIKSIRHNKNSSGGVRVVIDTHKNMAIAKSFAISASKQNKSHRIVLDLIKSNKKPVVVKKKPIAVKTSIIEKQEEPVKVAEIADSVFDAIYKKDNLIIMPNKIDPKADLAMDIVPTRKPKTKLEVIPIKKPSIKLAIEKEKKADRIVMKISDLKNKHIKKKKGRPRKPLYTIVIDPGHGGADPGSIGRNIGLYEKNITLRYARSLKKLLEKNKRYKVVLTRNSDKFMNLMQRRNKARNNNADIFISLHADSSINTKLRGASVYTLSEKAYDKEAQALSIRENKSDIIKGVNLIRQNNDIANMLIDLVQRDTKNISAKFAELTTKELSKKVKMIKGAHRFAGFRVLKGVDVPAILIELGYLSNRQEEKLLNDIKYEKKIINALGVSINKHFVKLDKAL